MTSVGQSTVISPVRVLLLGAFLVFGGMAGFYSIPGLMDQSATGSLIVNSFYCSVITLTTIGFGDICPGKQIDITGRIFLTIFPILGLGFFCGPILELAASWRSQVPGGPLSVAAFTLAVGISLLIAIEGMELTDALHFCIVLGTTIGYGDVTPKTDLGRTVVAIYAVLVLNAMGGLLGFCREYLESLCRTSSVIANGEKSEPNGTGDEKETAAGEATASTTKESKKDL